MKGRNEARCRPRQARNARPFLKSPLHKITISKIMNHNHAKPFRIMAVSPSTYGFGFAVLEGKDTLVDWGSKSAKGDNKNAQCLKNVEKLIARSKPEVMVLENCLAKSCRRRVRTRALIQAIADLAPAHGISVAHYSKEQVKQVFLSDGNTTKYGLAEAMAKRFPEDLGARLPAKRKLWENENPWMDVFEAVALVLASETSKSQANTP